MAKLHVFKSNRDRDHEDVKKFKNTLRRMDFEIRDGGTENIFELDRIDTSIEFFDTDTKLGKVVVCSRYSSSPGMAEIRSALLESGWVQEEGRKQVVFLTLGLLLACVAWIGVPSLLWEIYALPNTFSFLEYRGQLGDSFGSVNALFSALALGGVIYAILIQRKELSLQRQELKAARVEFSRNTRSQELSVRFNIFKEILENVQITTSDRQRIYQNEDIIKSVQSLNKLENLENTDARVAESIRRVIQCYQFIGMVIANRYISDEKALFAAIGPSAMRIDKIISNYMKIEKERSRPEQVSFSDYKPYYLYIIEKSKDALGPSI